LKHYLVYLKRNAEKELDHLPLKIRNRIIKQLISLQDNPRPRGTKKLYGMEGYRIRVGNYRILYIIKESKKKVEIISIAHRKEVHR